MKIQQTLISNLEKKGMSRLKISRECLVSERVVNNWACGFRIGPQSLRLLELLAEREGVL